MLTTSAKLSTTTVMPMMARRLLQPSRRFLRMLIPHGSLAVGVEDFCYWIWSGFFTFLFLYRENDGALRFYMIGSIFLSMLAYDRIISRNLRKVLKMVLRCIRMKLHR